MINVRMNKDTLLFIIWLLVLIGVILMTLLYNVESNNYYGIAETKELVANSENSVEIKRINVIEGQSIVRGQLLVELNSPELMMKINHISHQLEQLKVQKSVNKDELKSKIEQLEAQKAAKQNDIYSRIKDLQNQLEINKALTLNLKSIKSVSQSGKYRERGTSNPFHIRIEGLKKELTLALHPLNIQMELYQKALDASESPIKIQIESLEKELEMLRLENNKLNIYSNISGVIGSINFKAGEKVEPFAPILTLHTKNPQIVKGYINENIYTQAGLEEAVKVSSASDVNRAVFGEVVGVGSRIVAYPVRLRRHPEIQVWGREVIIKIPESNAFILGEKVMITSVSEASIYHRLKQALYCLKRREGEKLDRRGSDGDHFQGGSTGNADAQALLNISPSSVHAESLTDYDSMLSKNPFRTIIPKTNRKIEASGLLYLKNLDRYLLVSDDTPKNKPQLYLMNQEGLITKELLISGLKKISDIESITSTKEGVILISSSASANKKGKVKLSRRLLIAVDRKKEALSLICKIDLFVLLEQSADSLQDEAASRFIRDAISNKTLEIEGIFHDRDAIYFGIKSPLKSGKSVILKVDDFSARLTGQALVNPKLSIWQTVCLKTDAQNTEDTKDTQEYISDLYYENGQLFITGSLKGKKSGSLWRYDIPTRNLVRLQKFDGLQPEGVTGGREEGTLVVCFDQGGKHDSGFTVVRIAE